VAFQTEATQVANFTAFDHPGKHDMEVSRGRIGEGGERNVYNMQFQSDPGFCDVEERWVAKDGQSGRLGEAVAGHHGLHILHLKAWGCPLHS